jgi:PAS domain S-box-containing protein
MATPSQTLDVDLRRAEERLLLAIEAAGLGPWEWDITTGKVSWSASLEAIHGIPVGSFEGTYEAWQRDIHPDDLERVLATVGEGLARKTGHTLEYRIVRPDGAIRWIEVRSRLECDAAGQPARIAGVCMDITDRRVLDDAREMFVSILGHDLRNPLQAIKTASSLLQLQPDSVATVTKSALAVSRSADRMDRIIRDLLDFARGRLGRGIPVERQPMSLDAVCRRVVDELALAHPEAHLELLAETDLTGSWDPERIAQVASNLIGNAIAHGDGRVVIRASGTPTEAHLRVTNHGTPIAPDVLPFLFEPFYSRAAARNQTGLGLGLFIVHEIVRAHGGRVDVASTAADGTTFGVKLPR